MVATKNLLMKNWSRKQLSNRLINWFAVQFPFTCMLFFHPLHLKWLRMLNYLFVVKMIMQATGYQLVNWFAWYPFGCIFSFLVAFSDFIQVLFVDFFILVCIISSNDFIFFLILNLRIKDSLINIRFRNYWFKCCLVQLNLKHHKFFINLRPPIFINLL